MNKKHLKILSFILLIYIFFSSLNSFANSSPEYEFRGVWVATVTNIDWPSKPGLSTDALKKEALDIINIHHSLGMNTIILQIRPSGDAIYPTKLAPWSKYLTGQQGFNTEENVDLLKFWIDECHKRNMELHAWINPFRASLHSDDSLHYTHPAYIHPQWTVKYNNKLYYNPGLPEVRQHIIDVIADIVERYDINGIHIDDYFYPYPVNGETFNDSEPLYPNWIMKNH